MLTTVVLAVCVVAASTEWVEISQQHYRKPLRFTHNKPAFNNEPYKPILEDSTSITHSYPTRVPVRLSTDHPSKEDFLIGLNYDIEDETTLISHPKSPERTYSNVSLTEQTTNRGKYRAPGSTQRVNIFDLTPNLESLDGIHPEKHDLMTGPTPEFVTRQVHKDQISAIIERVPNIGNVKRVLLSNTPVKSPSIKNDVNKRNNTKRNSVGSTKINEGFRDEFVIKPEIYKDDREEVVVKILNSGNPVHDSNKISPTENYFKTISSTNKPSQNIYHKLELNNSGKNDLKKSGLKNISNIAENAVSSLNTKVHDTQSIPDTFLIEGDKYDKIHKFTNKNNQSKKPEIEDGNFEEVTITDFKINQSLNKVSGLQDKKQDIKTNAEEIKVNTLENVVKFMKVVTETISKNTKSGVSGKVKYLNELKDTLLASIKARIDATWPDDDSGRRRSRSTARGHVEFPSSESSLMTISFLTFAVFLIKLVLQVIQTYKNKTMMVAPLVVATAGRATRKLRNFT